MLELLRDLVAHKGHANAAYLRAIAQHADAAADPQILTLLHHVLVANRFWLLAVQDAPFVYEHESRQAESFAALVHRYAEMQREEQAWLAAAEPADLSRVLRSPMIPNGACSVAQAFTQVCMHSHGHRVECAKLLRALGGEPPASDFIVWVASRPAAVWPD